MLVGSVVSLTASSKKNAAPVAAFVASRPPRPRKARPLRQAQTVLRTVCVRAQPTARPASTGISAARYSAEPCRSVLRPSALTGAPASAAADQLAANFASRSVARNTPAPAPVTATRTPCGPLLTNTPTIEKREASCLNFCQPAFSGTGKLTAVITSPSASAVSYRPLKKSSAAMLRVLVCTVASRPSTAAGEQAAGSLLARSEEHTSQL